ncbi:hypothetical protein [Streptomyces sp. NPDC004296]|uniref:hypothetical protein n=1 Tax=Streptomyces sp. NPDC004296 TaxID=3364697 RepID=UPI00367F18C5
MPLDPQQVDMVDVTRVGGFVEAVDLPGSEVRGLVYDDACGLVVVSGAVLGQRVQQELPGVGERRVGLAVALGDLRGAAADDGAVVRVR